MKKTLKCFLSTVLVSAVAVSGMVTADMADFPVNVMRSNVIAEAAGAINVTESSGWLESAYVKWSDYSGAARYEVYVDDSVKLDDSLIRKYPTYWRADALGLKAGKHSLTVKAYNDSDSKPIAETNVTELNVEAHDRSGAAFSKASGSFYADKLKDGIGAYKNDGTLKSDAKVIYVTSENAKTVTAKIVIDKNGKEATCTGLQAIFDSLQKGYDTTPYDFRIVGTIRGEDMDYFGSSAEGLQIKGKGYSLMPVTIEGVGDDACIKDFGMLIRGVAGLEIRNFGVLYCLDDSLSLDTQNQNVWVHNMDMFYGRPGSDSDQKKGDGTIDIKGKSKFVTFSYNHFFDNGKSSLGGMKSESTDCHVTYHHNWFDHSDSRHPRIRTMSMHIYNNYFDNNAKYGVGMTMGGSAFVESNVFENTEKPMMISGQGTDANGAGTFSGESGGIIKAYNNKMTGVKSYITYATNSASFDAYEVKSRTEEVPESVKCKSGGTSYNNFDTDTANFDLAVPDSEVTPVDKVVSKVKKYAGRGNDGGDFFNTVGKSKTSYKAFTDGSSYAVDETLSKDIQNYRSKLVSIGPNAGSSSSQESSSEATTKTTTESTTQSTTEIQYPPGTGKTHNFGDDGTSSTFYTISGTLSTKGELPTGYPYTKALYMNIDASIKFNAASSGKLYLVTTSESSSPELTIKKGGEQESDVIKIAKNGMSVTDISKGEYTITMDSEAYIYYMEFVPDEAGDDTETPDIPSGGYKIISADTNINYSNYNDFTKISTSGVTYTQGNSYIRLTSAGAISFQVADGATVKVNAKHASSTDSVSRTLQLYKDTAKVGSEAVFEKGQSAKTVTLAEDLSAGVYTLRASKDMNVMTIEITFPSIAAVIKGDADNDGIVSDNDVKAVLNKLVGKTANINETNADVTGDNAVTILDARKIKQYLEGIITSL